MHVDGKAVTVDKQLQFYTPNNLILHPLVSPALGYLGGLPPLFIMAGDKEVLRDEIIFLLVFLCLFKFVCHADDFWLGRIKRLIRINTP